MDNICKICEKEIDSRGHFWRFHKVKESDYYQKFYESKDLLTGELIPFKSPESYLNSDFIDKNNLKKYLEKVSKEEGLNYLKNWLLRRKQYKNIKYAPSEFECRSLLFPSIKYIESFYGGGSYEKICKEIELLVRYKYNQELSIELNKELNFIVDTRENSILDVPNKQIQKLDVGDYTIENSNIIIEKKSLIDFCGTLSKGFDRFIRELERAKNSNKYLIILVEEKFNNIVSLKYLPHTKQIRATPDFIFHRAREIINKYPLNCQIVCLDGKKEAVKFINNIFSLKNDLTTIDYQYIVDIKIL